MTKRKTIGETPWDAVVPPKETSTHTVSKKAPVAASTKMEAKVSEKKTRTKAAHLPEPKKAEEKPSPVVKERLTVHVPVELAEKAKNAVFWTPGLTLARMAEDALQKAIEGLEKAHGGPFRHRLGELKGGRPLK